MSTTMVHVRVDEKTKQRATKTLAAMGMSVSDAVRMMLVRVVAEKALPFDVKVPNATTVKAMRAADKGLGKRHKSSDALFKEGPPYSGGLPCFLCGRLWRLFRSISSAAMSLGRVSSGSITSSR